MGKGKKLIGTEDLGTSDLSEKQSGTETKKEEELVMETTKVVLLLKDQSDVRERRMELQKLYGEDVKMIFVGQVSSFEALETLISKNPGLVMMEEEIIPKLVLAKVILNTEIHNSIEIRESLTCQYLDDDKTRWLVGFRGYSKPKKKLEFT